MRRPLTSASSAALLLSVLALLVAVAAFVRAGSSSDVVALPQSDPSPVATSTPEPEPTETEEELPTEEPTPAEALEDPLAVATPGDPLVLQAEYPVSRDGERLKVPQGDCDEWYVDVDAMRVTRESEASEVQWAVCSDPLLSLQTTSVAQVASPAVTPQECQEAIRTSPTNAVLKPSKGLVLCFISDGVGDTASADQQHITRLVVDTVNDDLSLGLTATTWKVG